MGFEETFLDVIDTALVKKPASPQLKFTNPLKKDIFVNSIVLSGGVGFLTRGKVLVTVNDVPVFSPKTALQFKNTPSISIPLNDKPLLRTKSVKVFAWNSVDTDSISLSVEVKMSEDRGSAPSNSGGSTLTVTPSDVRRRNSIIETVFAEKNWSDEDDEQLIDMEGYTKMILNIASSKGNPIIDSYTWDEDPADSVDNDAGTSTSTTLSDSAPNLILVDFGSVATRELTVDRDVDPAPDIEELMEISDDKVSWSTVSTINNPTGITNTGSNSFRYARITYTRISAGSGIVEVHEIYDNTAFGGSAAISFEVLDDSSGVWIELVSASEIGAIGFGTSISKQLGDVISDLSEQKFNVILPSTPTNFRAKIVVTGNLNTGVSIIKVD